VPKFIRRHQKPLDQEAFKSKQVLGVPFKLIYQRQGQPLPLPIIQIMKYLRKNSMSAVGIFRKSGSKLRMNIIREEIERTNVFDLEAIEKRFNALNNCLLNGMGSSASNNSNGNHVSPELNSIGSGASSHSTSKSDLADEVNLQETLNTEMISIDLADILKQYFRELPECLFTNKLSQTLIDIFISKFLIDFLLTHDLI
jgi:hypothetical protein